MTPFEWTQSIAGFLTLLAIVATVIVYFRQLKTMQGQLRAMYESGRARHLLDVVNLLQGEDNKLGTSRGILINAKDRDPKLWSEVEIEAARLTCTTYDIAGIVLQQDTMECKEVILKSWGHSIRKCHEAACAFIAEAQEQRGKHYFDDFDWLAREAKCGCARCDHAGRPQPAQVGHS